jgi:ADP-ribose pyrophosphatase YjhB (NUDIX family)
VTTPIEKVTAFVIRTANERAELLLFEHPYAGIQIPAGTVEPGEMPEAAVVRETHEETGLRDVAIDRYLGMQEVVLPEAQRMLALPTRVYARPDQSSMSCAQLGRGITVDIERSSGEYSQISYREWEREAVPAFVSYQITGWVSDDVLVRAYRRHFFTLTTIDVTPERWQVVAEQVHRFTLFWAPLDNVPPIRSSQVAWLDYLPLRT